MTPDKSGADSSESSMQDAPVEYVITMSGSETERVLGTRVGRRICHSWDDVQAFLNDLEPLEDGEGYNINIDAGEVV